MLFRNDLHSSSVLVLIGLLDFPYHCLSFQWKQYLISGGKVSELQQGSKSVQRQRSSRILTFFTLFFQYLKLSVINSNSAWISSSLPSSLSPSMAALDPLTYPSLPEKLKGGLKTLQEETQKEEWKNIHMLLSTLPLFYEETTQNSCCLQPTKWVLKFCGEMDGHFILRGRRAGAWCCVIVMGIKGI